MKYLNKILLFSLLVFAFACDKDGDDDDGMVGGEDPMMTPEEIAEEALTADSGWTITGIETNYEDIIAEVEANDLDDTGLVVGLLGILRVEMETIQECETDDVVKFVDGGAFDYNEGSIICDANAGVFITQNELFFEDGTWELKDENTITFTIVFEGETDIIDYTIETLNDTDFVLSSSINGNTAAEIDESVYQFTNNLDTRLIMTKAN